MKKTFPPAPPLPGSDVFGASHSELPDIEYRETEPSPVDIINQPPHYTHAAVEAIDLIESLGYGEGYCIGSAIKYLYRAKHKDDEAENLRKAAWHISRRLEQLGA